MPAYEFERIKPIVDPTAYIHPAAVLVGDVTVGAHCFVGPGASLRGDLGPIVIGAGSNVQDGCIIHCFPGRATVLEENAHIGHGAVVHGCTVGRGALVGIHAVVLDGAVLGEDCLVAANSLVLADTKVAARTLVAGSPAKVIRVLRDEEIAWKSEGTRHYQHLAARYLATCVEVAPLAEAEAGRPRLPDLGLRPKHEME